MKREFKQGEQVIYMNKLYEFGYEEKIGKAIIYGNSERNIQDSFVVNINLLEKIINDKKINWN